MVRQAVDLRDQGKSQQAESKCDRQLGHPRGRQEQTENPRAVLVVGEHEQHALPPRNRHIEKADPSVGEGEIARALRRETIDHNIYAHVAFGEVRISGAEEDRRDERVGASFGGPGRWAIQNEADEHVVTGRHGHEQNAERREPSEYLGKERDEFSRRTVIARCEPGRHIGLVKIAHVSVLRSSLVRRRWGVVRAV